MCSKNKKLILFACVHNSGRSQMAEAFAKKYWKDLFNFESAGTNPSDTVNPLVSKVMEEKGIDISNKIPRLLTQELYNKADRIITMGCSIEEVCPTDWHLTEDWKLDDPKGKSLDKIRVIRDEIERKIKGLFERLETKNG